MLKYELLNRYGLRIISFMLVVMSTFPVYYSDIVSGMDPSWVLALNIINNNEQLFGSDYFFTYGPMGWLLYPLDVGNNLFISYCFWIAIHICFSITIFYILFSKELQRYWERNANLVVMVIFLFLSACFRVAWQEHYFIYFLLFLLFLGLKSKNGFKWLAGACVLVVVTFLIKFTIAILSYICLVIFLIFSYRDKKRFKENCLMVIGGVPILFVGLFWAYNPNISVIVDYMLMAKEISSGYILAMSMPVDFNFSMKMAFVIGGFSVLSAMWAVKSKNFSWLALLVIVFMGFKHGVVRGDHINIFISIFFMTCSFYTYSMKYTLRFNSIDRYFIVFICGLLVVSCVKGYNSPAKIVSTSSKNFITPFNNLLFGNKYSFHDKRSDFVSDRFWETIGDSVFTVYPWEISYGLDKTNLKIMPILQQYAAYTPKLDYQDAAFLERDVDFIIFNLDTIDLRYPLLETPHSWNSIFSMYDVVDYDGRNFLLQKKQNVDIRNISFFDRISIYKGEEVQLPNTENRLFLAVESKLNFWGILSQIFWKIPSVEMIVEFSDGSQMCKRVLLNNLQTPTLIDAIPCDDIQFYKIMTGEIPISVKAIRFQGEGLKYYDDRIQVSFFETNFTRENKGGFELYSKPENNLYAMDTTQEFERVVDTINGKVFSDGMHILSSDYLAIQGWVSDSLHVEVFDDVYIFIDDVMYPTYTVLRPDVSAAFNNKNLDRAGYKTYVSTKGLERGWHKLSIGVKKDDKCIKKETGNFCLD